MDAKGGAYLERVPAKQRRKDLRRGGVAGVSEGRLNALTFDLGIAGNSAFVAQITQAGHWERLMAQVGAYKVELVSNKKRLHKRVEIFSRTAKESRGAPSEIRDGQTVLPLRMKDLARSLGSSLVSRAAEPSLSQREP